MSLRNFGRSTSFVICTSGGLLIIWITVAIGKIDIFSLIFFCRMREGQKTLAEQQQKESRERELEDQHHHKRSSSRDSFSKDDRDSPILNLSNKSTHENNSDISAEDDVYVSDNDDDLASNDESASNPLLPKPKSMVEPHDTTREGTDKTEDKVNNNNGNGLPSGPQVRKNSTHFVCLYAK